MSQFDQKKQHVDTQLNVAGDMNIAPSSAPDSDLRKIWKLVIDVKNGIERLRPELRLESQDDEQLQQDFDKFAESLNALKETTDDQGPFLAHTIAGSLNKLIEIGSLEYKGVRIHWDERRLGSWYEDGKKNREAFFAECDELAELIRKENERVAQELDARQDSQKAEKAPLIVARIGTKVNPNNTRPEQRVVLLTNQGGVATDIVLKASVDKSTVSDPERWMPEIETIINAIHRKWGNGGRSLGREDTVTLYPRTRNFQCISIDAVYKDVDGREYHSDNINEELKETSNSQHNLSRSQEGKNLSVEQEKRQRDIRTMERLLSCVQVPAIDSLIEDAPHRIPNEIFHFWEGLHAEYTSKLFHLYDSKLSDLVKGVYEPWRKILSFSSNYSGQFFQGNHPGNIPDEQQRRDLKESEEALSKLDTGLRDLLKYLRAEYVEIDVEALNKKAWVDYVEYIKQIE